MFEMFEILASYKHPLQDMPLILSLSLGIMTFVMGSIIGSFLNVVIYRVPQGLSVVTPRSRCPTCETMIAWYDNIPILTWFILGGKCRHCKTPFSIRYAFVEFLIGILAFLCFANAGVSWLAIELFLFSSMLVVVAYIDMDTWTIPYFTIFYLLLYAFAATILYILGFSDQSAFLSLVPVEDYKEIVVGRLLGIFIGFFALWTLAVLSTVYFRKTGRLNSDEEAMGLGDPLLLGAMGATLGWSALPLLLFLASFQGAIFGLILKLSDRLHPKSTPIEGDPENWSPPESSIQFGPFLAFAGIEMAFFGRKMMFWLFENIFNL